AGWFNIWAINAGSQSNGLQQAALDTLWYVDPNRGIDGVWDNSLAAEKPIYNADFTEMTARLRRGIHWSDGVEFTAADVVHTVATQIKHKNMRWSAALTLTVDAMETPDPFTVVFKLKKPNSRFHALFTVRWNAIWIMPKHVFEKVEDPLKFDFNKPVSLGAYVLHNYDPDGRWYIPSSTTGRCRSGSARSSSTPASRRSGRTMPPSAARSPTCCGRRWATRSRPMPRRLRPRSAWAGGRPIRRRRPSCWKRPAS